MFLNTLEKTLRMEKLPEAGDKQRYRRRKETITAGEGAEWGYLRVSQLLGVDTVEMNQKSHTNEEIIRMISSPAWLNCS